MENSCRKDGWTVHHLEKSLENPRVLTSVFSLFYCSYDLFLKWLFGYHLVLNLVYLETKIFFLYSPSCSPAQEAALATLSMSRASRHAYLSTPPLPDCTHLHTGAHLPCSLHVASSSLSLLRRLGLNLVSRTTPIYVASVNHVFSPLFPDEGRSYCELD